MNECISFLSFFGSHLGSARDIVLHHGLRGVGVVFVHVGEDWSRELRHRVGLGGHVICRHQEIGVQQSRQHRTEATPISHLLSPPNNLVLVLAYSNLCIYLHLYLTRRKSSAKIPISSHSHIPVLSKTMYKTSTESQSPPFLNTPLPIELRTMAALPLFILTFRLNASSHGETPDEAHGLDGVHAHEGEVPEVDPVRLGVLRLVHLTNAGQIFVRHLSRAPQSFPQFCMWVVKKTEQKPPRRYYDIYVRYRVQMSRLYSKAI